MCPSCFPRCPAEPLKNKKKVKLLLSPTFAAAELSTRDEHGCAPLTRGDHIHEILFNMYVRFLVAQLRKVTAKSELFTLGDTHSLRCASILPLVNPQALVRRILGPTAVANL